MSELTQQSGSLTRLASDLGRTRHKYHRTVHKYLVRYISRRLTTESHNLFLDNSITHTTKDECTAITKGDTNNAKHVAIDSAHAQCDQPTIGLAQRGRNTAYR